jgi:hypothetical protein
MFVDLALRGEDARPASLSAATGNRQHPTTTGETMSTRTHSRVTRHLARLRQYWADLDDTHRRMTEIRSPRVPHVTRQRHSDSATQGTLAHLDADQAA